MLLVSYINIEINSESFQFKYDGDEFIYFARQSLKIFTFRVKSNDSILFLFGLSPIVN